MGTAIQPHGDVFSMAISLDHSIFFHRPFDPTQWLLLFTETTTSCGARGLATTQVFQQDILVATIVQEVLMRLPKPRQSSL